MNILDALWGGAIHPSDRTVKRGSEYARLQEAAKKAYDRFWTMLTPEEKEAYTTFTDIEMELSCISDADIFAKGFRLGMRLLLAVISEEETQLPPLEET